MKQTRWPVVRHLMAGLTATTVVTTALAQDQGAALEEVVVTGSLISDPNHVAPSPIVIVDADALKETGVVTLEAALNQLPQFSPAGTGG